MRVAKLNLNTEEEEESIRVELNSTCFSWSEKKKKKKSICFTIREASQVCLTLKSIESSLTLTIITGSHKEAANSFLCSIPRQAFWGFDREKALCATKKNTNKLYNFAQTAARALIIFPTDQPTRRQAETSGGGRR